MSDKKAKCPIHMPRACVCELERRFRFQLLRFAEVWGWICRGLHGNGFVMRLAWARLGQPQPASAQHTIGARAFPDGMLSTPSGYYLARACSAYPRGTGLPRWYTEHTFWVETKYLNPASHQPATSPATSPDPATTTATAIATGEGGVVSSCAILALVLNLSLTILGRA